MAVARSHVRLIGACVFLLSTPAFLLAQWNLGESLNLRIQRGIDHIYNLEFYDAEKQFSEVIRQRPDHPAGHFFRAMIQWWRILGNVDDESQDDRFYDMLEEIIEMCDEILEKNPNDVTALFFKGGSLGFRGRLRVNRGNWFGAARDGITALPIVRRAHELDSTNYDVLLGIGIYNYYAEVVPDEYPFVKPLMVFFPSGDRRKGLRQLEEASQKATYARTEATYFLVQNYFLYEKNFRKALELAEGLNKRYPRNPVFLRYVGRCQVSLGMWEESYRVFSEVLRRFTELQVGFDASEGREAYYYVGKYFFSKSRYSDAREHFLRCEELSVTLDKSEASGFRSMANLYLGMIEDAEGKRREAVSWYRRVLNLKEFENTHREARRFLETPYKGSPQ